MTTPVAHVPVMISDVLSFLPDVEGGIYIDGTFGCGGYTEQLLNAHRGANVYAIDRDGAAIAAGRDMAVRYGDRLTLHHGLFSQMGHDLSHLRGKVDGILLDIGVSSPQLDQADRGFSFRFDGPLDMGMGLNTLDAKTIVNKWREDDIANILYQYGEERLSRRVARKIVEARSQKPLETTLELAELVRSVVPRTSHGIDPATRTFQGIRIAVNDELGELERGLVASVDLLKPGGRLVVVTFHSLEDRCVKTFLNAASGRIPNPSRYNPGIQTVIEPVMTTLTRKAVLPSSEESKRNPRSRSAKLRAGEKR